MNDPSDPINGGPCEPATDAEIRCWAFFHKMREDAIPRFTNVDMREAVRAAYEDAARIVMESRGDAEVWRRLATPIAHRLLARTLDGPSERGHGELPHERNARLTAEHDFRTPEGSE